jgi:hypothetical protein
MPVTHGVAGSSPVQTAKLGEALWKQSAFLPKKVSSDASPSSRKSIQNSCVVFDAKASGLVVRPMKSFPLLWIAFLLYKGSGISECCENEISIT